ncbi:MAG: homocysteine S-methyltransferase family protein [Rhodospirillaceae bacterium]|nr:homocysteine S-methyltransferase family protein [Rhodospirillaceae bacterium]
MPRFRHRLPQTDGTLFLTDGGLEIVMMFKERFDLPFMSALPLLNDPRAREAMRRYFARFAAVAAEAGVGLIVDGPTWRASPDWGAKLGYSPAMLAAANRDSIAFQAEIRAAHEGAVSPIVLSAAVGPRGDGYVPGQRMSAAEAAAYHAVQIGTFADTEADMVSAYTINYVEEAIGIARAAKATGIPAVISFTVETDGRLPTGQALGDAIEEVDADTGAAPAYYMINCAHPSHFAHVLAPDARWIERLRGLRGNASRKSHAELDESETLDEGDPAAFGAEKAALRRRFPHINVLGGCCGTDHRHVAQIAEACRTAV